MPPGRIPARYPQPPAPRAGAPGPQYGATDGRAIWGLILAVGGGAIGLVGLAGGAALLLYAGGDLASDYFFGAPVLNGFAIGIPALVLGPAGYFLGKSAAARIAASEGKLGGHPIARAASWIGIPATAIGAASTLGWIVITLLGYFGPPPA